MHKYESAALRGDSGRGRFHNAAFTRLASALCIFASKPSSDGERQHLGLQTALMATLQALILQYLSTKNCSVSDNSREFS